MNNFAALPDHVDNVEVVPERSTGLSDPK